ncbi:hypothetical protein PanWU01x14_062880 [Parasponia andersonii]|uniref:Uncharacterized protein n=1 Tax=Parasponia andersonii TaxID=3476 RepID=A0A2P5DHN2_PARAD|nr:hypothetical protein PanWU01x14_062880 [Parasponia andersonii]
MSKNGRNMHRPKIHNPVLTLQKGRGDLKMLSVHPGRAPLPSNSVYPGIRVLLLVRPRQAPEDVASRERLEIESGIGSPYGDEDKLISKENHFQVNMRVEEDGQDRNPHQDHDSVSIELLRMNPREAKELVDQGRKRKPQPLQMPPP